MTDLPGTGRPSSTPEDGHPGQEAPTPRPAYHAGRGRRRTRRPRRPGARLHAAANLALCLGFSLSAAALAALLLPPEQVPRPAVNRGTLPVAAARAPVHHAPPAAAPTRLRIPSVGLDKPLSGLSVQQDGRLAAPSDPADVGWWREGPAPGDPGAAILVGHVDSATGPGAFYGLSALRPGAVVTLDREDGTSARFTVQALRQYEKDAVPDSQVYASGGPPALRLITCGGAFDEETGYHDNLVVYAGLAPPPTRTPPTGHPPTR